MKIECTKTRFATEKDALFYIGKIKAKSKRDIIPTRAYLCRCGTWHLTSKKDFIEENNVLSKRVLELEEQLNKTTIVETKVPDNFLENTVKQLRKENQEHKKLIQNLRKDNSNLVGRIIQLGKKD